MRLINVTSLSAALLAVAAVGAGCSGPASYDERMAYLRTVAKQGAETHQLLVDQAAPAIDIKRCTDAWTGLQDQSSFPSDTSAGSAQPYTEEWARQIQQFFVDSCVSGKPKPVPGDPVPSANPSPAAPSTSPSTAPSTSLPGVTSTSH